MTSYKDIESAMLTALSTKDYESDEATKIIRNLKTFNETKPVDPPPLPEPEAKQTWIEKHSEVLIKSGFSFLGVLVIVGGEKLANHMYNTKAWSVFPK